MKNIIKSMLIALSLSATALATTNNTEYEEGLPILVRKAQAETNLIIPDVVVVTGLELRFKKNIQRFVVQAPGSEGMPMRYENRTRDLGIKANHNAHSFILGENAGAESLDGTAMTKFQALTLINKMKAFLLVKPEQEITPEDQALYHPKVVVIRSKDK